MKREKPVSVVGAGGHAKVVLSTLQAAGVPVEALYDDDERKRAVDVLGVRVRGGLAKLEDASGAGLILGIGDNRTRKALAERFSRAEWVSAIHPGACVHPTARIGKGTVVFAGAVVQPGAVIGDHCIVNTGAIVDHDCVLEDFVHIAPGVKLAGNVHLHEGVFIGIGGSVVPGVTIGSWAAVGAGGVVVENVASNQLVAGIPARPLHREKGGING